jgi:hypothetical protein
MKLSLADQSKHFDRHLEQLQQLPVMDYELSALKEQCSEISLPTFTIEQTSDELLVFRIHTCSAPGNLLARLVAPFFSIPYQRYCTQAALRYMRANLS